MRLIIFGRTEDYITTMYLPRRIGEVVEYVLWRLGFIVLCSMR